MNLRLTAFLLLLSGVGCHKATAPPKFHVVAAYPDKDIDVVASYAGKEYGLSVDRGQQPLGVAYYEPIDVPDVGHDFDAKLDSERQVFEVLTRRGWVGYNIENARESTR